MTKNTVKLRTNPPSPRRESRAFIAALPQPPKVETFGDKYSKYLEAFSAYEKALSERRERFWQQKRLSDEKGARQPKMAASQTQEALMRKSARNRRKRQKRALRKKEARLVVEQRMARKETTLLTTLIKRGQVVRKYLAPAGTRNATEAYQQSLSRSKVQVAATDAALVANKQNRGLKAAVAATRADAVVANRATYASVTRVPAGAKGKERASPARLKTPVRRTGGNAPPMEQSSSAATASRRQGATPTPSQSSAAGVSHGRGVTVTNPIALAAPSRPEIAGTSTAHASRMRPPVTASAPRTARPPPPGSR